MVHFKNPEKAPNFVIASSLSSGSVIVFEKRYLINEAISHKLQLDNMWQENLMKYLFLKRAKSTDLCRFGITTIVDLDNSELMGQLTSIHNSSFSRSSASNYSMLSAPEIANNDTSVIVEGNDREADVGLSSQIEARLADYIKDYIGQTRNSLLK